MFFPIYAMLHDQVSVQGGAGRHCNKNRIEKVRVPGSSQPYLWSQGTKTAAAKRLGYNFFGAQLLIMVIGLSGVRCRSVIIRVITKLDDGPRSGSPICNHEYDYRPTSEDTKSHYQLIISITISDCKCPITCKCPINALIVPLKSN